MAWIHSGVCLVMALIAAVEAMHCSQSDRIAWIPEVTGIDVYSPWEDYPAPESMCCNVIDPESPFNAQEKCSLCYNLTKSTPGFAADPNNCQKFYMCEPAGGPDKWNFFSMTCPNCTFWDQDKLTCVQVFDDPDGTGVCGNFTAVTDDVPITTFKEDPKLFCIDFENQWQLADYGVYVYNDGVELVNDSSVCPIPGSQCGHFLGSNSRLEVPFFSNNYDSFNQLVITMYYRKAGAGANVQGILSNDCFPKGSGVGAPGNSLYCSVNGSMFDAGMKSPAADVQGDDLNTDIVFAKIKWDGSFLSVELRQDDPFGTVISPPAPIAFNGPIRNSHCPLVIGSFIKEAATSFFEGYMDNICFYKWDP